MMFELLTEKITGEDAGRVQVADGHGGSVGGIIRSRMDGTLAGYAPSRPPGLCPPLHSP